MADKWVKMYHPKIKGSTNTVTETAFNRVWKRKGWKLGERKAVAKKESKPE